MHSVAYLNTARPRVLRNGVMLPSHVGPSLPACAWQSYSRKLGGGCEGVQAEGAGDGDGGGGGG